MTNPSRQCPSRRLIVLGSTGSIGVNALAVVDHLRKNRLFDFEVVGLAAGSNSALIADQARRFGVQNIAISNDNGGSLPDELRGGKRLFAGLQAADELILAVAKPGDLVLGAIVGSAGIPATLSAIEIGCDIALANKESLVAAGSLVMPKVRERGVHLLPVDSEHSAIYQCLEASRHQGIKGSRQGTNAPDALMPGCLDAFVARVVLTASGGPFRTWSASSTEQATVEEALNHPTWSMGPKVTVDSASLMNKALEIIEAHWLFGLESEQIDVIIHPQSLIHSFVEFVDGSVVAQLGPPDMRTPIQYALTWPKRLEGCSRRLKWNELREMSFEPVDEGRFIAPRLAHDVIEAGGTAGAIFNAANEAAVAAFLDRRISFGRIAALVQGALENIPVTQVHRLDDVMEADGAARRHVQHCIAAHPVSRHTTAR